MSTCYIPECTMVSSPVISKRSGMLKYKQQCFALYFNYNLNKRVQQDETQTHTHTHVSVSYKARKVDIIFYQRCIHTSHAF